MRKLIAAGLVVACSANTASADPSLSMAEHVDSYYGGEAIAAYVVLASGVASTAGGAALVTRDSDFARGIGWPLLTLGALEVIGSVIYAIQVAAETDHYRELLARDPRSFAQEELEHIRGTTTRFLFYRLAELGLTVAGTGIAIYGAVAERELFTGIGVGVAAVALPIFVIDTFNQRRAVAYQEDLSSFKPSLGVQVGEDGWSISVAGSF